MISKRDINKAIYKKSNSIRHTILEPSTLAVHYAKRLLTSMNASDRQALGQGLLHEISRVLSIPSPQLCVNDERQNHSLKDGKLMRKTYGMYKEGKIIINNKTAIREAVVAPKTFLDTLIHEFMHHYDYKVLKLQSSLHTAGFYYRLGDVMKKLIG